MVSRMQDETLEKLNKATGLAWQGADDHYYFLLDKKSAGLKEVNESFECAHATLCHAALPFELKKTNQGEMLRIAYYVAWVLIDGEYPELHADILREKLNRCTGIHWKIVPDKFGLPEFTNETLVIDPYTLEKRMKDVGITLEQSPPDMCHDLHLRMVDAEHFVREVEWQGRTGVTPPPSPRSERVS